MIRYGIPLLDELRAVRYARRILAPFLPISPNLPLTDTALAEREKEILASEEFHEAVGNAYDFPCANLREVEFRNKDTGETRTLLTCGADVCRFAGKPVDPEADMPECDHYRVPQDQINNLMLR